MLNQIWLWLANSPLGSAFKAASGAVLVYILDNVQTLNLSPIAEVAIIAALPVIINAINPEDGRYGLDKDVSSQ